MNSTFTKFSALLVGALLMIGFSACTQETTGPGTSNGVGATNLMAGSPSDGAITVKWKRASTDFGPDTVIATPPTPGSAVSVVVPSNLSTATLTGLTAGVAYSIVIKGNGGTSNAITWAPAIHSGTIRLWETADNRAGHLSGLALAANNIRAVSVSANAPERSLADVVFYTDEGVQPSRLSLISGAVIDPAGRLTRFGDTSRLVMGGFSEDLYSGSILSHIPGAISPTDPTGAFTATEFKGDLDATETGGPDAIILLQTVDNHFARVDIQRQSNGKLYGTDGENFRYIDVKVSSQQTVGLGYVARPHPMYGSQTKRNTITVRVN